MRRCIALAAAAALSICMAPVDTLSFARQNPTLEYQVKAAFLFNFAKFIQWPNQAFVDRDALFSICVAGDPFEGALEKTVEGEMLNGRRITVRQLAAADNLRGCQIVYFSPAEGKGGAAIIKASATTPILTVGESDDFISSGGMIRFIRVGPRVRFEINPDAVEKASLRVSSRLLRLADIVRPRERAGIP